MRKTLLMMFLAIAVLATGCGTGDGKTPQETQKTEQESENTNPEEENKEEETAELETENKEQETGEPEVENKEQEADGQEQGTENTESQKDVLSADDRKKLDDFMAAVKEQSDELKASMENDELTQFDMNQKSQELYELWDGALNQLWSSLKARLSENEFVKLLEEQRGWLKDKEKEVEEAGKEVEGGSLYPLVVNSVAAQKTEERVYELYSLLK